MRVFLSYRQGDDVGSILQMFNMHNVEVFDSMTDIQYGDSVQHAIKTAIKNCDFIFVVYSELNPYVAFETGVAVALNKPIFSVLAGGKEPYFLYDSTYVHAYTSELEKIKFSFELFLKNIRPKTVKPVLTSHKQQFYGGGEAIPMKHNFDIAGVYSSLDRTGHALEVFFKRVFEAYSLNVVKNSTFEKRAGEFVPDFSIWSDPLSNLLGNPILIEVVSELSPSKLSSLESAFENLKSSNPANGILIFYDRLRGVDKQKLPHTSTCLFICVSDLVDQLQNNDFATSIRTIRNKIVHQI